MYSRAVYAIKISNAKRGAPFEFTYSWGDAFLLSSLTVAHSVPLCRQTAKEEKEQQKSPQIRSITFPSAWPCALLSPVPLLPIPASVWFSFLSLSLETSPTLGCSQCFSCSEVLIGNACAPQKHLWCPSHRVSNTQWKYLSQKLHKWANRVLFCVWKTFRNDP